MTGGLETVLRPEGPRVWALNLDAEHELEAGAGYAPTRALRELVARQEVRLASELLAPGDYLVREGAGDGSRALPLELVHLRRDPVRGGAPEAVRCELDHARGLPGLAWSPTPRALARLRAVGARPEAAPDPGVLRAVNARPFAAGLRAELRGGSFEKHVARGLEEALARLSAPAPDGWLVRRTFGAAGRGRRRLASGRPDASELAWLVASLRLGPLVIEPWVRITRELTRSGWVDSKGAVVISRPCFQATTRAGAWTRTEHAAAGEVSREDDDRSSDVFERVGRALAAAGYTGPFGIDAYRHRVPGRTREVFNPLSEINARFTMDWALAVGMARLASPPA